MQGAPLGYLLAYLRFKEMHEDFDCKDTHIDWAPSREQRIQARDDFEQAHPEMYLRLREGEKRTPTAEELPSVEPMGL